MLFRSTLIVAGAWAQSEAALRVTGSRWEGLGDGHGYLSGRDLTVSVAERGGPSRTVPLHLPDRGGVPDLARVERPDSNRAATALRTHPAAG